jgi:hypothetical protein
MIQSIVLREMRADVIAVRQILDKAIAEDDLLGRFQYEDRVHRLEEKLRVFEASLHGLGEVLIELGGGALMDTFGLDLVFVNRVIESFEQVVVLQAMSLERGIANGPRANLANDTHSLVATVSHRGFILREISQSAERPATMVPQAIHQVGALISALGEESSDGDAFLGAMDPNVRNELAALFATLDDVQAWLAIVEGECEFHLSATAVRRARVRLDGALSAKSPEHAQVPTHTAHRPARPAPCHP